MAVLLGAMLLAPVTRASPPRPTTAVKNLRLVDEGSSLSASATVFGLDRKRDSYVSINATAQLELACINPAGKKVPSQKPHDLAVELEGYGFYPRFAIIHGGLDVFVETDRAERDIPGAPDCPNSNWTERVEHVRFVDTQVTIRQGSKIQLDLRCFFNPPTKDGRVPKNRVTCFDL